MRMKPYPPFLSSTLIAVIYMEENKKLMPAIYGMYTVHCTGLPTKDVTDQRRLIFKHLP